MSSCNSNLINKFDVMRSRTKELKNRVDRMIKTLESTDCGVSVIYLRLQAIYQKLKRYYDPETFVGISFPVLEMAYRVQFKASLDEDLYYENNQKSLPLVLFFRKYEDCTILYQTLSSCVIPWVIIADEMETDLDVALNVANNLVMVSNRLEVSYRQPIPTNIQKLFGWN
jgi:site-specific DNA-adenine methylase